MAFVSDERVDRLSDILRGFRSLFSPSDDRPVEYLVLLLGHDGRSLQHARKTGGGEEAPGAFETLLLPPDSRPATQAAMVLQATERMLRRAEADPALADTWLLLEGLPVGLYEAVGRAFEPIPTSSDEDAGRLSAIRRPRPFLPAAHPKRHDDLFAHQVPGNPVEWQDREFSLDLLDAGEREQVRRALLSRRSVLLTGDRGTGKTLLARFIHYHSFDTAQGAFVEANLAAIPETLLEQELFGIAPGTATDVRGRDGLLREANNGTLFLDEIAETSTNAQAKLLRIVSERIEPIQYRRLGETRNQSAQVRFIAATNLSATEISARLRRDLHSRFPIRVHLKRPSEKQGDPFGYGLRAIEHFSSIDLAYNPALIPSWDRDALQEAFHRGLLPDNFRDLHSFVTRVWDTRIVADRPWLPHVGAGEVMAALRGTDPGAVEGPHRSAKAPIHDGASALVHSVIDLQGLGDRTALSEEEMKDLVFGLKHLALRLATWYADGNRSLARRVYGMRNPQSFEKLCQEPSMLHPNTRKRSGTRR